MGDIIFTKIMDLIEKETDMPLLQKNLENWLDKNDINKDIYEIYEKASKARRN